MVTVVAKKTCQSLFLSRSLCSRMLLEHSRPFMSAPRLIEPISRPTLPNFYRIVPQYSGNRSLMVYQSYLYSTSTSATANPKSDGQGQESSGESNQKGEEGKSVRGGPVSWLSFFLLVITGAGIIYYYDWEKKRHIEEIKNNSQAIKEGPSAGEASIGGPFRLINHEGKYVTEKDFLGKWTLVYFGFTHCPDICPEELQKLAAAVDKIKEKSGLEVLPVFISVDPERDSVEQVRAYIEEFHPKLVGLTGTPEEIRSVARSYRVYYMKTTEKDSDYLVDHSIVIYLMDPNMKFAKYFGKNNDVDALADGVINEVKRYKK